MASYFNKVGCLRYPDTPLSFIFVRHAVGRPNPTHSVTIYRYYSNPGLR